MEKKQFVTSLEAQKDLIQHVLAQAESCSIGNNKEPLDGSAEAITAAIYSRLELSTQKTKASKNGEPWWNEECRMSLRAVRQTQKYQAFDRAAGIEDLNAKAVLRETRLMLRKVVKGAKQKYYQKLIDRLDH